MGNIFNEDFRDFIKALNQNEVKYILVGGYSVILHGYPRTTGDMDVWVERTPINYTCLSKAFSAFGMPMFDMNETNFLTHPNWDVFRRRGRLFDSSPGNTGFSLEGPLSAWGGFRPSHLHLCGTSFNHHSP